MSDDDEVLKDAEALLNEYAPEHQRPGDITKLMAQEHWQCGPVKAERVLAEIVAAGKAVEIHDVVLTNGKRGRVWRRVKQAKK